MFKVGDKVIRKAKEVQGFWTSNGHSSKPEVVKEVIPGGGWSSEEEIKFEGDQNKWYSKYFDLYVEPAKAWTPKYAVGDKIMPAKAWTPKYAVGDKIMPAKVNMWQRPVVVTGIECKFIYKTGASYLDNVPEEKIKPFVQAPREITVDGVVYREVT